MRRAWMFLILFMAGMNAGMAVPSRPQPSWVTCLLIVTSLFCVVIFVSLAALDAKGGPTP